METEESGIFDGRLPAMVRTQLAELVHANGPVILEDPKRVKAMLSDTVATARREINLISLALSEGVAERLLAVRDDPLRLQAEQAELIRQLVANHALHADAATWAVESCAWSLGIAVSAEPLRHTAARDTGPSQPRTTPGPSQQAPTPPQTVVSSVFEAEQPQPPRPEATPEPPRPDPVPIARVAAGAAAGGAVWFVATWVITQRFGDSHPGVEYWFPPGPLLVALGAGMMVPARLARDGRRRGQVAAVATTVAVSLVVAWLSFYAWSGLRPGARSWPQALISGTFFTTHERSMTTAAETVCWYGALLLAAALPYRSVLALHRDPSRGRNR